MDAGRGFGHVTHAVRRHRCLQPLDDARDHGRLAVLIHLAAECVATWKDLISERLARDHNV